jgi:hypothetical protein
VWWILDALWIQRSPVRGLLPLGERSIPTLIVCGDREGPPAFERRGSWLLRRLSRSPSFQFEVVGGLDHAAIGTAARSRLVRLLLDNLMKVTGKAPTMAGLEAPTGGT